MVGTVGAAGDGFGCGRAAGDVDRVRGGTMFRWLRGGFRDFPLRILGGESFVDAVDGFVRKIAATDSELPSCA